MSTLERARRALGAHRARMVDDPAALPAAVAVLLIEGARGEGEGGSLETLFIRRADRTGDPWSGQVAFPGGRRQPEDSSLLDTALRETREETGVSLAGAERLGQLDDIHPRTPLLPPVFVRPFVFALPSCPALELSDEVQAAFWLPLRRLSERGVQRDITIALRGGERRFPAYVVDDDVIWGMTERILTPLIQLIEEAES